MTTHAILEDRRLAVSMTDYDDVRRYFADAYKYLESNRGRGEDEFIIDWIDEYVEWQHHEIARLRGIVAELEQGK
jgi:hypothetical protein